LQAAAIQPDRAQKHLDKKVRVVLVGQRLERALLLEDVAENEGGGS